MCLKQVASCLSVLALAVAAQVLSPSSLREQSLPSYGKHGSIVVAQVESCPQGAHRCGR